ncbi:4-(cytidine 5'-diphospho)-2-C-methyl-D-erythritol kinase [Flavimaricola marinus]|uniref:4-diphosphocytidyl-2-C-methyl-D-erythritol kinase n=1 Tax=Flavimaricola marinus TaxID=1819565 RepID=A0A238LD52_9RHOB|nr:4-(cytidine 5'-diphospho)-2-C-methyl-D-erythritol kinase [Flavimaricola marinus]SMY06850.1 4-diphosphocytidyl-2-C-methyl-D-erythritol kinase [Flavimaricola marinus]
MSFASALAPAKINLTLHVTGKRPDGYHLLDSLVVFGSVSDEITATVAPELSLDVSGPFAEGVPRDESNSILRAAHLFQARSGVEVGAHIRLIKALPHAAGIGSGSSDAAATLALLAELWGVPPLPADDPDVLALGADVPACRCAPQPVRMEGIGERLSAVHPLPNCAMVLVNPKVPLPTGDVFQGLARADNPPMDALPHGLGFDDFCQWLKAQRNDLQAPAEAITPEVGRALTQLNRLPAVGAAVMSGSGATCVGLVPDIGTARQVARVMQVAEMGWWVAPAEML